MQIRIRDIADGDPRSLRTVLVRRLPGADEDAASVATHLVGLAAGVTYRYRLVAENVSGTSYGPTNTFTTHTAGMESDPASRI